jgi:hypothetical protein
MDSSSIVAFGLFQSHPFRVEYFSMRTSLFQYLDR